MAHEDTKEHLSALADGALTSLEAVRVVDAVAGSDKLRCTWARYHLIGEVMRTPGRVAWSRDLAERVRQAMIWEPALLAPRPRRTGTERWYKSLAGMAIAASVAVVAVLSLPRILGNHPATADTAPALAAAPATQSNIGPVVPGTQPVGWAGDETGPHNAPALKAIPRSRLNGYLVNYSEQRALIGSPGVPYVRVVGYDSEQP
jgi:sigma-E factor negative regulatory protein RseA